MAGQHADGVLEVGIPAREGAVQIPPNVLADRSKLHAVVAVPPQKFSRAAYLKHMEPFGPTTRSSADNIAELLRLVEARIADHRRRGAVHRERALLREMHRAAQQYPHHMIAAVPEGVHRLNDLVARRACGR